MKKLMQLTGTAAMTAAVLTGSYATASAVTSTQGSDECGNWQAT